MQSPDDPRPGLEKLLRPRVCELGKIKIGRKSAQERQSRGGGTWRAPEKLDHFIVTTLHRDAKGDLIPDTALMESLAEFADHDKKLRQLPVTVLSNEIEDILTARWECYLGKTLSAYSDGETLTQLTEHGKKLAVPKTAKWTPEWEAKADSKGVKLFKLHTTLNVVITASQSRWGGYYKFRTVGRISADQLYGSLLHLKQLTGGVLRGLPMRLVVRPIQVSPDGKATTVYVVHLELRGPDLAAIQQQAVERAKFELANRREIETARLEYKRALAIADRPNPTEEADIAEEFHPDSVENAPPPPADPIAAQLGITPPKQDDPPDDDPAPDWDAGQDVPVGETGDPDADPFGPTGTLYGDEGYGAAR